jgi:hypothetical protein
VKIQKIIPVSPFFLYAAVDKKEENDYYVKRG